MSDINLDGLDESVVSKADVERAIAAGDQARAFWEIVKKREEASPFFQHAKEVHALADGAVPTVHNVAKIPAGFSGTFDCGANGIGPGDVVELYPGYYMRNLMFTNCSGDLDNRVEITMRIEDDWNSQLMMGGMLGLSSSSHSLVHGLDVQVISPVNTTVTTDRNGVIVDHNYEEPMSYLWLQGAWAAVTVLSVVLFIRAMMIRYRHRRGRRT